MSELDKIGLPPDVVNELCNINDPAVLYKRIQQLEQQNKEMLEMLKVARCPNVKCVGGAIPNQIGENEWEPQQCQWCYERGELIAKIESQKGE